MHPLSQVPQLSVDEGLKGADGKMLMLRSICVGIDPVMTGMYEELKVLVATSMDIEDEARLTC